MKTIEVVRGDYVPVGYINAGGRGTRLNGLFNPGSSTGIAKALLEIGNPKVKLIDHHIDNLRQQNIEHVVVAAGDQHEVYEYVQDIYARESEIIATKSDNQLGTGGDLVEYARHTEANSPLLVQNVDTILDIDLMEFYHQFFTQRSLGAVSSIALTLNKNVPNEGAYSVGISGRVLHSAEFNKDNNIYSEENNLYYASSTGAVVIDKDFLRRQKWNTLDGQFSLYRDCLYVSWLQNGLYAYNNQYNFFRDVGTIATWLDSQTSVELQAQLCYSSPYIV